MACRPLGISIALASLVVGGCGGAGGDETSFGATDSASQGSSAETGEATSAGSTTSAQDTGEASGDTSVGQTSGLDSTGVADSSDGGESSGNGTGTGVVGTESGGGSSGGPGESSGGEESSSSGGGQTQCGPVVPGGEKCLAPGLHAVCDGDGDPFHAIGLNCPGDQTDSTPIANEVFESPDADAWHVITQFGDDAMWSPSEGTHMLIIGTGNFASPDGQDVLTQQMGITEQLQLMMNGNKNGNPDNQQLPAPMQPIDGSNMGQGGTPFVDCDCVNDCSDTLETQWELGDSKANDLLWFQFELDVPGGTYGFEFDFAFFSSEYPEWVDTEYNDVFVVWSSSETYTGNITFINDQPLTVTALENEMQYGPNNQALDGTGFDGVGGGTGWYTAIASAAPYEHFSLTWAIFDMGDSVLDTAVLIDNWRWSCTGCLPEDGCGITPQ